MKTTVEIQDELLVAAKKRAADLHCTLRELIESGLRRELRGDDSPRVGARSKRIRWVTVKGGLPPGADVSDREKLHDWIRKQR